MTIAKTSLKRILVFAVILALLLGMAPIYDSSEQSSAATTYKYTREFIKGGGDLTSRFTTTVSGKTVKGLCTQGGPLSDASGKCTITTLSRTNSRFYMAYYYGYKLGWTSGANGCHLARAFNYAKYGTAYHQSASTSKSMINTATSWCQKNGVPSNFVVFECTPTNGAQKFLVWGYYSNGSIKIVKKSSDASTAKTGAYTFKDIKYKVYTSKSTSSTCVGTLTCNADGTTSTLSVSPDGNAAKTYYIKEYSTNDCYELNDTWYTVSVGPGAAKTVTVTDTPEYGTLTFMKAFTSDSVAGTSTDGYKFTLVNTSDSSIQYTATSKNGIVTFNNVLLGTYTLSESLTIAQMSEGVTAVTEPQTVEITAGTNTLSTSDNTFYNELPPTIKPMLVIQKKTNDGGSAEGYTFKIENTSDSSIQYTATTDENGRIKLEDVPEGEYKVTEVMTDEQKARYKQPASQTGTLAADDTAILAFEFTNEAIKQPLSLKKTSSDGLVEGIGFTITGTKYVGTDDETDIMPIRATTDENGVIDFGELCPGEYVLEETGFDSDYYLNGYELEGYDNPAIAFTVTKDGVFVGDQKIDDFVIELENVAHSVALKKTAILSDGTASDDPVAGAEYTLYKVYHDENNQEVEEWVGCYTTDENGEFFIDAIAKGDYKLYETVVPTGYIEEYRETTDPETGETLHELIPIEFSIDENTDILELEDTNQQDNGTVFVVKEDQDGNPIEDAEFTLFTDEDCTTVAKDAYKHDLIKTSDSKGYLIMEDIPWGTYYLKETGVPRGYNGSDEVTKVVIGYDDELEMINIDFEYHITNTRKTGNVELLKIDEDGEIINGTAVYDLYASDGTLVKEGLQTGADNDGDGTADGTGRILIKDLDWGSYYFLESQAPTGYAISDEKIRFTINSMSAGATQRVNAVDKINTTYVVATKKILADDIWWANGTPTFIFNLTGTNAAGDEKAYHKTVTFTENYVESHTDDEGYVSMSVTFTDIDAGEYVLSEDEVSRYDFSEIETATLINGTINNDETVSFNLTTGTSYGAATFVNDKYEWQDYSSSTLLTNLVKKQNLYTAVTAEFTGDVMEGNKIINDIGEYLKVYAIYDDGTEVEISSSDYTVVDVDGNTFTRAPKVAGFYTLTVTHEENGITHSTTVQIEVEAAKKITVHFDTTGGEALDDMSVWKYDTITDSTNDTSKYTPTRTYYNFLGWYEDADLTKAFDVSRTPVTEEITLYAKWEHKHVNEYSWSELKAISESGEADEILGECFDAVQADLADDGKLSSSNYKHTKVFQIGNKSHHAMIAGFDHDALSDGSGTAGITFMVYEPVTTARMNATSTNEGGWGSSEMRNTTLAGIYGNLPSDLTSVISQVNKTSVVNDGGTAKTEVTADYLFLPSQVELYGAWGFTSISTASAYKDNTDYGSLLSLAGEGSQYALFKSIVPDGTKNAESALARGEDYWTRSIDASSDRAFCKVDTKGAAGSE